MTAQDFGQLAGPILTLAFIVWLCWGLYRRKDKRMPVADEPDGTPYRIYTTEFDRVVMARDAPALMKKADRGVPPGTPPSLPTWPARMAAVSRLAESAKPGFAAAEAELVPILDRAKSDLAVMLLIDQSGSMRDNILPVAATVRWLSDLFDAHGVPLSITGFTTLGWRGGDARRQWMARGRPERPGRLCALLHIRYRDFGQPLANEDWRAMAHPEMLRENIDGEAIEWATREFANRSESRKVLIVLSDGAPVDDSTLMENGELYLERHIRRVIADVGSTGEIRLGAVGIEYRVDRYYSSSVDATDLSTLPTALASQLVSLGG